MKMDKELARHVVYESFKASSKINNLIPLLKKHCDKDEYDLLVKKIAAISGEIGTELMNYVFANYPEIEEEIDSKIEKYSILIS
jgi:hypothetical protein